MSIKKDAFFLGKYSSDTFRLRMNNICCDCKRYILNKA
jgi:hypothetical protein